MTHLSRCLWTRSLRAVVLSLHVCNFCAISCSRFLLPVLPVAHLLLLLSLLLLLLVKLLQCTVGQVWYTIIILAIATSYTSENNCMCMGPTINTDPPSPCFKPHIHTIMVTVYWLWLFSLLHCLLYTVLLFWFYQFENTSFYNNKSVMQCRHCTHAYSEYFSSRQHFLVLCMQKTIV